MIASAARSRLVIATACLTLLTSCGQTQKESPSDGEAPIPIASTHREIVVVTTPLKADMTFSIVGLRQKAEKDDGATRWNDQFEEQVEAPYEGFVRRRFRVTLANGSDQARQYAITIDYVSDSTGEVILSRSFRRIFVPPFTKKQVSGYTPIREDRVVHAELHVSEVTEGE